MIQASFGLGSLLSDHRISHQLLAPDGQMNDGMPWMMEEEEAKCGSRGVSHLCTS